MQETDLVDLHVARRCDRLKLSISHRPHHSLIHPFTPVTKGILRRLILAPTSACLAQLDAPSACCRCLMPLHICHRACLHKHSASRLSKAWTNPEGTDEQQRAVVVQILHRPRVQTLCFRGLISCVPFALPHDRIDRARHWTIIAGISADDSVASGQRHNAQEQRQGWREAAAQRYRSGTGGCAAAGHAAPLGSR